MYIGGNDAQLVLDKFLHKCEVCTKIFFDCDVDENDKLCQVFWANSMVQRNFACFGDVVSFDATYHMDKFVHSVCVTIIGHAVWGCVHYCL